MAKNQFSIPDGFCQCGCGQKTNTIPHNDAPRGLIKGKPYRFINGHSTRGLKGDSAKNWKGGKRKSSSGYILIYKPDHPRAFTSGCVYEHILIAEDILGRPLIKKEVSHHINGIKDDNRKENIMIFKNNKEHMFYHRRQIAITECGHPDWRKCYICKQWDSPDNLIIYPNRGAYHKLCRFPKK